MLEKKRYYIIAIFAFSLLITFLHFLVFEQLAPYVVFEELYYIPLLFGALMFGLKGAILTYLIVSVAYVPFFYGGWATGVLGIVDRVLHLLFSGLFAFLAGFFCRTFEATAEGIGKKPLSCKFRSCCCDYCA